MEFIMKINKKLIILILYIFIIFNLFFPSFSFAGIDDNNIVNIVDSRKGIGIVSTLTRVAATVLASLQVVSSGIALIMFSWAGIKYFTASTAAAKAKYKGQLFYSFLGGVFCIKKFYVIGGIYGAIDFIMNN